VRDRFLKTRIYGYAFGCLVTVFLLIIYTTAAAATDVPQVRFTVERFVVEGDNPFSDKQTQKVLRPFLGDHEGLTRLEAAAAALGERLKKKGYAFSRVVIPPQKLKGGVVTLNVLSFRLDQVTLEGNKRFSEENILASLPPLQKARYQETGRRIKVGKVRHIPSVQSDRTLNTLEIARMLQVANEHPTKKIAVFIRQGETPETINARVAVREERPYQFFSTFNNTGSPETGRERLSLGFQYSNLFKRDHSVTLSYTTSPAYVSDVTQLGVFYRVPVYKWATWFSAFYSYSSVDQGVVAGAFDVSGAGNFAGIGAEHTLRPMGLYSHKVNLGFQDRLFENNTIFADTFIGLDVRSQPVLLRYMGRVEKAKAVGNFYIEYAVNTGFGADNDDVNYAVNRAGADENWQALRYGGDVDVLLPKNWRFLARLLGQAAGEPLIPGEQFGLGGLRSVRGYDEREISSDSGQFLSGEVWTPPFYKNFRLVGFLDAGWAQPEDPHPARPGSEFISVTGLGIRWFWKQNVSLSVDASVALDNAVETESGDGKIHFNLFLKY